LRTELAQSVGSLRTAFAVKSPTDTLFAAALRLRPPLSIGELGRIDQRIYHSGVFAAEVRVTGTLEGISVQKSVGRNVAPLKAAVRAISQEPVSED